MIAPLEPNAAARAAGLRYLSDDVPGIRRRRAGRGWRYVDARGEAIQDEEELQRIRALVIPPAWTDVWISPDPRGHIQATGRDERGRKQYRYHDRWRAVRDESKFEQLVAFGEALPLVREQVETDLSTHGLTYDKTIATIVRLLDESLIRIGNEVYVRENRSFGLTTLRDEHVDVSGEKVHFTFRGKSGKLHEVDVRDRRVARVIRTLQDLPGQLLFQFRDKNGELRPVRSEDVNDYLHAIAGEAFTAKDFRTWAGSVLTARALRDFGPAGTVPALKANIVAAIDATAARLGNTRAVCRASYIHPAVLAGYERGDLLAFICSDEGHAALDPDERWLLAYLHQAALLSS
jgi:DNA topoisomerase I